MRIHLLILLGLFAAPVVGCEGDKLRWSEGATEGYRPSGFKDLEGDRSDAPLGEPMRNVDYDRELREHMDKQDSRWSDRDYRKKVQWETQQETWREQDRRRRAAARRGDDFERL
jgi:hypothetical protein